MSVMIPESTTRNEGASVPDATSCYGGQAGHAHHRKIPPAFIEITCPHYILVIQFPQALMNSYANIHELQKDFAF